MDLALRLNVTQGQLFVIGAILLVVAIITTWIVGREIWFAVYPDKRPLKRKRKDEEKNRPHH